ncbi:MAG: anion permease [Candidatus Algichlamydia australiensis]|nr:anion permease [Chlamydiales bacterium]
MWQQFQPKKVFLFMLSVILGLVVWLLPTPEGVTDQAWQLLAIFVFTIAGIISKPLPMGAMAFIGLMLLVVTGTLTFEESFSGFNNNIVWLIVFAFFIARGFIKTGLGSRLAFQIMRLLGKSTLGMGYGLVATDLLLAPAIPSLTARAGGVIFPVLTSLAKAFGSEPHSHPRKLGSYLMNTAFQGSVVTSAMFLTSMAGNPLVADLVAEVGVTLNWGTWALAACVPGILSLLVLPYVMYKIYPPEVKQTPDAKDFACKELKAMGPIGFQEWVMLFTFVLLITLWVLGPVIQMKAAAAALLGLCLLLLTKVISWDDIIKEKGAWNILIWFATLITMAGALNKLGLTKWFSSLVVGNLAGVDWMVGFIVLALVYYYSHYFFASNVAHIGSMFPPFLILSVGLGTPPALAALTLAFFSSLFGGLTHYGCGPAPIFFGAGYVPVTTWWRNGFVMSVIYILIWGVLGGFWWKALGLF